MTTDQPQNDQPDAPEGDEPDADALKAEVEKWKGLARKHEQTAKSNAAAARKLVELEEADKSELQRAQDAAKAAEERAKAAELNLARANVALRKNLTEAQAKRLQGTSEEELEADADDLLALLKPANDDEREPDMGLPRRPQERLRPGARPQAEPEMSIKDIVDRAGALTAI